MRALLATLVGFLLSFRSSTTSTLPDFGRLYHKDNDAFRGRLVKALKGMPHYECATASVMSGLGDILAQLRRQGINDSNHNNEAVVGSDTLSSSRINWNRTFQFMIKGVGEGLLWTIWYRNAEPWSLAITRRLTGGIKSAFVTTFVGTVVALVLDLTLACPFIYATWDIPLPALLRGTPLGEIPHQIRRKIGEMLVASAKVWTPVNILIYNVPVQYRVYIMSFADVFWQSIVSSIVSTSAAVLEVPETIETKLEG